MRGSRLTLPHERLPLFVAVAIGALAMGVAVSRSPILALLILGALGVAVATARFGLLALAATAFGLLPWLVILEGVLPAELGTLAAAAGTAILLLMVWPLHFRSQLIPAAAFVFVVVVLGHAVFASDREEGIQAAKYLVFAAIALATSSESAREAMRELRWPVYGSCLAAMFVHLGVIAAGLGASSTYYEAGEKLGYAAEGPHALALISMIVAVTGLAATRNWQRIAFFGLGAVPAILTGVRSALLGLAVGLAAFLVRSDAKLRALAVLAVIATIAFATGAMDVVSARFAENANEFSSFSTAGSGRGEIWTIAFNAWDAAGPWAWVFGTGLRSIVDFELASLGAELVGHSDIVEVLVQIGALGFAAWVAIWIGLLRSRSATVVLLPILAFGAVNGSLEYVASLTAGIVLAAAFAPDPADATLPEHAREPEDDLVERHAAHV